MDSLRIIPHAPPPPSPPQGSTTELVTLQRNGSGGSESPLRPHPGSPLVRSPSVVPITQALLSAAIHVSAPQRIAEGNGQVRPSCEGGGGAMV
jgi:hypothetical protein